jgi:hypothetical protein
LLGTWNDEAGLVGGNHGLCPIAEAELAEDVADVGLEVAEHESLGDLLVRESLCDRAQNFEFAAGE